ncbi:MAG: glycine cleavage system aminomethyltransferase GcvT [Deltaproteobacteria bacterium]|nr:glycine cleavage system aminomethyltransferase GcvT [Deltaproteobacteria bacterium]
MRVAFREPLVTDLRRTPFHAHHVAAGARMVPFAGWDMPVQYRGITGEHVAVREKVGLFDVSHMGEIRVRGPKAAEALQWLLSNDVAKLAPGQAQYNALCNPSGGIVDDVFAYRIAEDDFLVCVNASNRDKDFAWFSEHLPHRDGCTLEDQGDAWAQVAIQGPRGVDVAAALCGEDLASLGRHRFLVTRFADIPGCIVARTGYTGEDGFEIFLPADEAEPAWPRVLEVGAEAGIEPIGLGARDTLRLEARNVLYGHEIDDTTSPLQANLGWITKLKKEGGFLGSDAIVARKETDTTKLAALKLDGKRIARDGMTVHADGRVVGRVTSGTLGPYVGHPIALAMVEKGLATVGTPLSIDVRGNEATAAVVDAFYKRS